MRDGRKRGPGGVGEGADQRLLDGRDDGGLAGGVEPERAQLERAVRKAEVRRQDDDEVELLVLEHLLGGRVVDDGPIEDDPRLAVECGLELGRDRGSGRADRLIDHRDVCSGRLSAPQHPAQEGDDGQRGDEEQGQRAGIAAELGNDAAEDRGHAKRVHRALS